jgi:short-subunit dehydrogenase
MSISREPLTVRDFWLHLRLKLFLSLTDSCYLCLKALRLALYHMQHNQLTSTSGRSGTAILVTSTSGYFGSTGVGAYIASKHGITGLLRGAQEVGRELGISINAVAPSFTPTPTFKALGEKWKKSGLKPNTLDSVATAIALACTRDETGKCYLVLCLTHSPLRSSIYADAYIGRRRKIRGSRRKQKVACSTVAWA